MYAQLCPTLYDAMECSPPASSAMEFSRQEYWSGLPRPSLEDLPNPGIEPESPASLALEGDFFTAKPPGKPPGLTSSSEIQTIKMEAGAK